MNFYDFVVFSVCWWFFLICFLPIGIKCKENPAVGIMRGTPSGKTYVRLKMLASTVVSACCTFAIHVARNKGYI